MGIRALRYSLPSQGLRQEISETTGAILDILGSPAHFWGPKMTRKWPARPFLAVLGQNGQKPGFWAKNRFSGVQKRPVFGAKKDHYISDMFQPDSLHKVFNPDRTSRS